MAEDVNRVHHVVWLVRPENIEKVRSFWQDSVGLELQDLDLPVLGLHVLISWEGGIEIMSPVYDEGTLVESSRQFLETRGEGVFSVVYNVADIDDAVAKIAAMGGELVFRETITADEADERELASEPDQDRFEVRQALFEDICGMRVCLQEIAKV